MQTLLFLAVLMLAGAVYLVGEVVTLPGRERNRAVRRAATYGRSRVATTGLERLRFRERVLLPATASLAGVALKLNPRVTLDSISTRLLAAGMGRKMTPTTFLALKAAGGLAGGFMGFAFGVALLAPVAALPLAFALGLVGFLAPGFVVSMRARKRREEIRTQLPDALDLLAVSVEAGLGFDGAISKLTDHMDGPLTEEFGLTLNEIRIGESRQDALKKLSARCDTPEVSGFSRAIIQADQLGISLGRILRVQATDTRLRRQAAAEEKAMKAPIKMLFPTVLFIFPAMFLVILGPAFLNLSKVF
jgi:tight adherence protein C